MDGVPTVQHVTPARLDSLVAAACAAHPEAPALVGDDRTLTFAQLASGADAEAARLASAALCPGMPVVLPVSGLAADVAAMVGVWRAGGVVVPLHRSTPPPVVASLLERTGAGHTAGDAPAGWPSPPPGRVSPPVSADSAYVLFTSGSTGRPKGVVLSHEAFAGKLSAIDEVLPFGPGEGTTTLLVLQLSFVYAHWVTLLTLLNGGRVVLHPRFDAGSTLAALRSERVDRLAVVPTMLRMLLPLLGEQERAELRTLASPGLLLSGGEVLPPGLGRAVRAALPHAGVADVFGTTETSTSDFIVRPEDYDRDAGLLGPPSPGVDAVVVDEASAPVTPGGIGELRIRTRFLMTGYLNDPEATGAAVVDGWLRTGDLATARADGRLQLAGRAGTLISRGGTKVSPLEVEAVYAEHPAVAIALCTGVFDEVLGERNHLLVVRHPGVEVSAADLRAWGRGRVEPFKVPDVVHLVDEVPLGSTGKADRSAAKEWATGRTE